MRTNLTITTDSYKLLHWPMYPEGTEYVYSYFEARNGARFNKTVFFGLQYLLDKYLRKPINKDDIEEGEYLTLHHLGDRKYFNREMWEYILKEYGGYIPLRIKAVPEGTPVDVSNILMSVENTDPKCAPLTNHFETLFTHVWGPSTVASLSREVKILCNHYLGLTAEDRAVSEHLPFMLHDFGFRGVNQLEAAGIAGAGHLINFMGTDTIPAMLTARDFYDAEFDNLAFSVPASEHSVMTARGEGGEKRVFLDLLTKFPKGILSVVIDSFDYRRFIKVYSLQFKQEILNRDGKVVFRPDSGEPVPTALDVLEMLGEIFGYETNSKGYKQLNPKVGVIWGDGIDYNGIRDILFAMKNNGWSASNIVFGMGGGLLQKINRDTQRFAFKSSAQCRDGCWYDIYKKPLDTSKASKRGKLKLIKVGNHFKTVQEHEFPNEPDILEIVYDVGPDGYLMNPSWIDFEHVRRNAVLDPYRNSP